MPQRARTILVRKRGRLNKMRLSEADNLFSKAYGLHVVDEKHTEAIPICRKILKRYPSHNMARMLLANLLDDFGNEAEIAESRMHYLEAIRGCPKFDESWGSWREEDPIYNLAVWEFRHGKKENAELLLLLDHFLAGTGRKVNEPKTYLLESLSKRDKVLSEVVSASLQKFVRKEISSPMARK